MRAISLSFADVSRTINLKRPFSAISLLTLWMACYFRQGPLWVVAAVAVLFSAATHADSRGTEAGRGALDELSFSSVTRQVRMHGWAAPQHSNVYTSNIRVFVAGKQVYQGRIQRSERPDVVEATGREDWLTSGWRIAFNLPESLPEGRQSVSVSFLLSDGAEFSLPTSTANGFIDIPQQTRPSRLALAVAALAVLAPLVVFFLAGSLPQRLMGGLAPARMFGVSVIGAFVLLVATGLTGSSVRLALDRSAIAESDTVGWFGSPRDIRSDEWRILTQMAIGQVNHNPPFPILNRNVGSDGNNMLIVGMTGVPVAHPSAVAKPATWGFFFLDLRRALAWHWWFPFFSCFLALWAMLVRLFRLEWRISALLSITVAASPYSIVFSGHPAYTVFFPVAAVLAAHAMFRESRTIATLVLGGLFGVSIAGFVLVLYVPWQLGLTYLMLPVALVAFYSRRQELRFGRIQLFGALAALFVAAAILASWWVDTREVLATVAATVYPGQRATSVGGDIDPWFLIKGMMSPVTMYSDLQLMDQSDAGSFVFVLMPLLIGVIATWGLSRKVDGVSLVLVAFIGWTLYYMFFGFSQSFANLTLWGRATSYRMDLPLGVAQALLLAWFIARRQGEGGALPGIWKWLAGVMALLTMVYSIMMFQRVPVEIVQAIPPSLWLMSILALGVVTYCILSGRFGVALGILVVWCLGTSLPFNPVGQAPTHVTPSAALSAYLPASGSLDERRIAILDEHGWTVTSVAIGMPTVNTVMYYPQSSLWKRLDPTGAKLALYNRYQHLLLVSAKLPAGTPYRIESHRLDAVRVLIDPAQFDFRLLGVSRVLTASRFASGLAGSSSLRLEGQGDGWLVYRVAE